MRVDHEHVDAVGSAPANTPSASHAISTRSMPDAEPDARRGRAAHLLGQPVVATAAADRVLRGVERVARNSNVVLV